MSTPEHDAPPGVDLAAMRARLLAERAALLSVSETSADSRNAVELDQTSVGRLSRMDAMQQQAMALATERRRAASLARIDAALARIDSGAYGWCTRCGEPVPPGRLHLDPATPTCVACAGQPQG
jgi:DnaK suppressor protein